MKYAIAAPIAALALCLPHLSLADFAAKRDMRVSQVNTAIFEVYGSTAASSGRYWCGAGDYAARALNAPWTAQIYVVRGRGSGVSVNKRTTVQFTLDPEAAGIKPSEGGLISLPLREGRSQSVQLSLQDCTHPRMRH
ncbi:hypothetical protein [Pontibaca salina]|uniref:Uncharacterized protein n=1 Tax=Pontibaca salina TaxID=2795731 RepID=A0A934HKJ3_9RHOB|nr:hypothetical protein [Pontibaca salina]MBI6629869.1 hypothetical protein [Pontibaca salina]